MRKKNQTHLLKLLTGVAFVMLLFTGSGVAQMDPGSGSRPQKTTGGDARWGERRTTSTPSQKPDTQKAQGSENQSENSITSGAEPGAKPEQDQLAPDPLTALRNQVDAAPNAEEKLRLKLKLVDQLVSAGKNQDGLSELRLMAAESRFDPQSFYNIGNGLARLGDSEAAVIAYRKAIDQRKGRYSRALNNLGVVLMRLGRWQEANDALTTALRLESFRYAEASYNLGRLYATQGQVDLAIREWRRAVSVDPQHTAAAQAIANADTEGQIVMASQPEKGRQEVKRSGVSEPRESVTKVKLNSPARTSAPKILTVDQVTYNELQRARNARERGKDQEAIESYRNVISRMGGYFGPANLELSYILIGMKQADEALAYLREVTTRDGSRYPISYYHLARLYEFKGQLESAAEAYGQAASYYRGINPQFLLDISRVREKRGDYKGSLAALEEYLTALGQQGLKPEWSEERLVFLRQKLSESQPKE